MVTDEMLERAGREARVRPCLMTINVSDNQMEFFGWPLGTFDDD